jgi:hypothetical protein
VVGGATFGRLWKTALPLARPLAPDLPAGWEAQGRLALDGHMVYTRIALLPAR